jgi:hypothetical protein
MFIYGWSIILFIDHSLTSIIFLIATFLDNRLGWKFAKRKKCRYTELWQGIPATNRCILWLDIHKRKETEAVQQGKRYDSNKDIIEESGKTDSQLCQYSKKVN